MVKRLTTAIGIAFVLWTVMFSPWTAPFVPFWEMMTCSAVILTAIALWNSQDYFHQMVQSLHLRLFIENILLGVGIAVALWGVFWLGDKVSQWLFPAFARTQVNNIYGMKGAMNPILLSCLLLFIIGPAEELFWRGYVHRTLLHLFGFEGGWQSRSGIIATILAIGIYGLVHIFSLNFMLIMAALVCGAVWGGLYYLFPQRFPAIVLSHALWDAAVFVWFPI